MGFPLQNGWRCRETVIKPPPTVDRWIFRFETEIACSPGGNKPVLTVLAVEARGGSGDTSRIDH
ncbi:hypothetical protein [Chromobacterium haemolyticum]|uniref:hypothetical protein n=1 Tax=Chromobacterium haemolyticum TaxID=394935 RepID=UPI00113263EB|nr:hypothetical protein [Chromobacterium haemolyticum]